MNSRLGVFRIRRLKHAVAIEHECRAEHAGSQVVVERAPDGAIWRGRVDIFDLSGHPQATRCYAWLEEAGETSICRTMLCAGPVESAQTALRVALAGADSGAGTDRRGTGNTNATSARPAG